MSKDPRATSFGGDTGAYEAARPDYPADAVAWMLSGLPEAPRVVDLGAGTGKLTRVIASVLPGARLTAVDPDAAMLDALAQASPEIPTAVGSAEELPLDDASVDAVALGQAWHWVDPVTASAEIGRVLEPGGVLDLIWNIRDSSVDWVRRYTEIMHFSDAEKLIDGGGPSVAAPFGPLESRTWEWRRPMTREKLKTMAASRSYLLTCPEDERTQIFDDLDALFDELDLHGDATIDLPYSTVVYRALRES